MTQLELQDAIIKHALDLQRLSANEEAEALAIIREMEDELRRLLATASLTDAKKREVEAIIKEAEAIIAKHYDDVAGAADIRGITVVVAEKTVDVLRDILPAVAMPSAERLASLSRDILIDGAPASAWWARQSEDTAFKFAREVREGVLLGEAQERIVSRIIGRGDEPGILDTARRNVRTLVHSSVMTAANRARLETYRKNMASGDTLYWLATLDGHVCPVCMALDGSQWDRDGNPVKGNKIAWNGGPPAHFGCRCTLSLRPGASKLRELVGDDAIDAVLNAPGRASKGGPTSATSMQEFLKRQSPEFIEEMLGKGRAELFLEGRITVKDLVSGTGRELSLAELRAR